jgi:type VI secretion system protein ImpG
MHREFRDLYNRELALLKEQASEFAQEYPGIADRLGGLLADRLDPMIGGLLEGAAFLAARVQLKLKHEFSDFTVNLLDQLVPHYLAPTPSVLLAQVRPPFGNPDLRDGRRLAAGGYLDATYRERDRSVACRFRLTTPIDLWPLEVTAADYHLSPAPLQALGVPVGPDCLSGLRLTITLRAAEQKEDEPPDAAAQERPELRLSGCRARALKVHLLGAESDAIGLYELLFGHCAGLYVRHLDAFGDPVVFRAPDDMLQPIGFGEDEGLVPNDERVFEGADLLRDYFVFPRKFLGFSLERLNGVLARVPAKTMDLVLAFDDQNARLSAAVRPDMFALYAAPAVNLFEKTLDRVTVRSNRHEYQVVPDRSRMLDFEPNRIIEVQAHLAGDPVKVPVAPLYSSAMGAKDAGLVYTVRRLPRRRTAHERQYGFASDYTGTDMFIALGGAVEGSKRARVAELSIRALCTNRHLPETLPVGEGGADFRFLDNVALDVRCVVPPTKPLEPVLSPLVGRTDRASTGEVAWRLINMMSLNHLGLVERAAGEKGRSLKEVLALFADLSDAATERKIRGLRSVDSRPIVRRIRRDGGVGAARGLEVTVLFDDKSFEGSGVFLLGAVLDRFFAEYVSINQFTQLVVRTIERGEIMRWPARIGVRPAL